MQVVLVSFCRGIERGIEYCFFFLLVLCQTLKFLYCGNLNFFTGPGDTLRGREKKRGICNNMGNWGAGHREEEKGIKGRMDNGGIWHFDTSDNAIS